MVWALNHDKNNKFRLAKFVYNWFDFEILDWLGNGFKVENMVIEDSLIFFGVFKQTYVEV
jgi:hypothetical protein